MKVTEKITIADVLRGCSAGRVQSVGCMQVIPLVSDITDDRFAAPDEALVSTSGYGTLVFKNESNKTMIIPPQTAYIVNQAAQDHALPHAALLKAKAVKEYNTAMCIQQTQGGYIQAGKHDMIILPFLLREKAHKIRNKVDFRRLWNDIGRLNKDAGVDGDMGGVGGHLDVFLKHFEQQLSAFVAEFEPVPKQVGAVIMIGGSVAGIERTPSYDYWKVVWPALIRECYGSLAIMWSQRNVGKVPDTRTPLKKATSIAELRNALKDATEVEKAKIADVVNGLLGVAMSAESEESDSPIRIDSVIGDNFLGQVVRDGPAVVYGSIIAKEQHLKKTEWEKKAKPFAM